MAVGQKSRRVEGLYRKPEEAEGRTCALGLPLLLMDPAIMARRLLRQGRRLALHLVTGGEVPPGTPGV